MLNALLTVIVVCALYGAATSFFQESLDWLQKILGGPKISNMAINILIPALVTLLAPIWTPGLGDLGQFTNQVAVVLVPLSTFLFSQLAHGLNKQYGIIKKNTRKNE